jgi:hypothetical protein
MGGREYWLVVGALREALEVESDPEEWFWLLIGTARSPRKASIRRRGSRADLPARLTPPTGEGEPHWAGIHTEERGRGPSVGKCRADPPKMSTDSRVVVPTRPLSRRLSRRGRAHRGGPPRAA